MNDHRKFPIALRKQILWKNASVHCPDRGWLKTTKMKIIVSIMSTFFALFQHKVALYFEWDVYIVWVLIMHSQSLKLWYGWGSQME